MVRTDQGFENDSGSIKKRIVGKVAQAGRPRLAGNGRPRYLVSQIRNPFRLIS